MKNKTNQTLNYIQDLARDQITPENDGREHIYIAQRTCTSPRIYTLFSVSWDKGGGGYNAYPIIKAPSADALLEALRQFIADQETTK